ncbi:hypothetical protein VIBNISFn27_60007 [Vibrio nigripulchritudo SFn27]|uniref:Uncharacterized protein n=1 Tax=Vibrio nigripulchritudo TaxID=28173 RepID=U4KF10_9VIBR|nr:hypothetical protein VIBNIBLFn1_670203 [Vibrio nigripulchritudo BLFn1]CCN89259.1 hypothetical protein VIBNISFn27_60007 [Vibrio nigripulchritudo SFn27]CCN93086.1 hypothetical protein VIBNIENn2_110202 [Vibrio nigripulchritudo ENn2]CCO40383.1 hypothetical protein VIBNISFn135_380007 [Vibrio nigripulchritudo SFn135]CCO55670.1 hypothetical protein VIBNIWn13_880007 [Vibrio nigripulchritudo Wn13]CCO61728.1 hypothetical protein VIBNI_B2019 [Vibrio nigripulchritudo]
MTSLKSLPTKKIKLRRISKLATFALKRNLYFNKNDNTNLNWNACNQLEKDTVVGCETTITYIMSTINRKRISDFRLQDS